MVRSWVVLDKITKWGVRTNDVSCTRIVHKKLQACTPCTDDLIAGATVVNGDATIPNNLVAGATIVNGDTTIPNDIVVGATVVNGDITAPNDLVIGTTVSNGDANIPNDLVEGATVFNGDATIPNDLVAGNTVINVNATIPNDLVASTTVVNGDTTIPSATVVNGDATSSGSDYDFSSDGYSSNKTDNKDLGEELSEGKQEDNNFFVKLEENYIEENIFAADDLKDIIKKQKAMLVRNEKGYYPCRQRDKQLYDDMMSAYAPYITTEAMKQLNHLWHTQTNEAMNTSVSAFALKGKIYSMTNSLLTR